MIIENNNYEDIRELYINNNEGYISKQSNEYGIQDEHMLKLVCIEENIAKGYVIICFDKNFCELEKYPNKIKDIPSKVAYIWAIITGREYVGKGIGSKLLKYAIEKFNDYTFYSCIEEENIASIKLHEKFGFKRIYKFTGKYFDNRISNEVMFELRR